MSTRTRSMIKGISVIVVLLCVLMELDIVIIPFLSPYKFWLVVVAFGFLLVSK